MSKRTLLAVLLPTVLLGIVGCPSPDITEGTVDGDCIDGVDNDGDGTLDCDDPSCASSTDCGGDDDDSAS